MIRAISTRKDVDERAGRRGARPRHTSATSGPESGTTTATRIGFVGLGARGRQHGGPFPGQKQPRPDEGNLRSLRSRAMSAPRPLLDEALPRFDASEVHGVWVPARPQVVFAAVNEVTVREVRLLMPLEALRRLPGLLARRPTFRPDRSAPMLDAFTAGVVSLGERPRAEIAAGAIGRFWRLAGNEPAAVRTREDFVSFR